MADTMFDLDDFDGKSWGDLCDSDDENDSLFDEMNTSWGKDSSQFEDEVKVNCRRISGGMPKSRGRRQPWTSGRRRAAMHNQSADGWHSVTRRTPRHMKYIPKSIFHLPVKKKEEYYAIQKEYGDVSKVARTMGEGAGAVLEREGWIPRREDTVITEQMYKRERQQRAADNFQYVRVNNDSSQVHYIVYQRRSRQATKTDSLFTMPSTKPSFTVLRHQNLRCD